MSVTHRFWPFMFGDNRTKVVPYVGTLGAVAHLTTKDDVAVKKSLTSYYRGVYWQAGAADV